jgi:UDP-N-acetylmuramate: L-alanyl-gamma-D-glutamyl-meso-diaminopimelate ligase
MKVHFIAIGGSAMHNLALALHRKGYEVSGSDDEIFEPALSRLKTAGILPENTGWFPGKINDGIDAIILGMHAREDNPELQKAREIGLKIFSYPEYLYEQSKDKQRIVIGGSHGKTTITAIILHVMRSLNIETDYMVGAQLEGFDVMVKTTDTAKYMVIEGDEYLTSPIDRRPKFHVYKPDIGVISGIAWDHINVFPTFENYVDQFRIFAEMIPENGSLVYCAEDKIVTDVSRSKNIKAGIISYKAPDYYIKDGTSIIKYNDHEYPMLVFGHHNMLNIEAARSVLELIGVRPDDFYSSVASFKGAAKRLELISSIGKTNIYKDFAHSPSKLKATIEAVKGQFPDRKLIACMELHTFSSLNTSFLEQYEGSMDNADTAIVYYNRHALDLKKLPYFETSVVADAFKRQDLIVFNETTGLLEFLLGRNYKNTNLLIMSSGNFDGLDLKKLSEVING